MARGATTDDASVVHLRIREVGELACQVARFTSKTRRQVIGRSSYRRHARKYLTVVAVNAATENSCMDHGCAGKIGELACRVAQFTRRCGRQMIARLGNRRNTSEYLAVMTIGTVVKDTGMAHCSTCEIVELACRMAQFTRSRGRQMIARPGNGRNTCKYLTVMAVGTIIEYADMVHRRTRKAVELTRGMASFANGSGWKVIGRF